MSWLQVKLTIPADDVELMAESLQQLGALSVTFVDAADQPIFEPGVNETPLWQNTEVVALFEAGTSVTELDAALRQRITKSFPPLRADPLEDKDWIRAWMDHYHPMDFGHGLWICPSHLPPPATARYCVMLDPGLAFGTGTHPTTAMCLRYLGEHPPRDQLVIDYGCGSGVLALAAARLGAQHVYAIDNDPQAVLATGRNAEQNHLTACISTGLPGQLDLPVVQTLLANILAEPLIQLAPTFAKRVETGGNIVISGILARQAKAIMAAYQQDFHLQEYARIEDWVCLAGNKM